VILLDFSQIKKKVFISTILGLIVVFAMGMFSDFNKLAESLARFDYRYLPIILLLAPLNYFLRFAKWNYYLGLLGIKIERRTNLKIFISGLGMTVTPGKLGEFIKAYLIKEVKGIPVSVTSPLIVAERLTDSISMIILASIGALTFRYGIGILAAAALFVVLLIFFIRYRSFAEVCIRLLKKLPLLKRIGSQIDLFYKSSYELLSMRSLLFSVTIGTVSWAFEGLIVYLVLKGFNTPVSILSSMFTVSFATIMGAISMLPGGLFVAEGSIMGILIMMGVPREIASAATIITRFSTLWLGVAIGIGGLISVQRSLPARSSSTAG
jgi:uncharacterized protein (TIRG00374 family)